MFVLLSSVTAFEQITRFGDSLRRVSEGFSESQALLAPFRHDESEPFVFFFAEALTIATDDSSCFGDPRPCLLRLGCSLVRMGPIEPTVDSFEITFEL
jgi:hypothetical protein